MDADLQDPPEVVHAMIEKWKEGYDVIGAERASRDGESRFKRATADLFYRLIGALSETPIARNAGDFRLIDRKALDFFPRHARARPVRARHVRLGRLPAGNRELRPSAARRRDEQIFAAPDDALATNGLISFSDAPLRLALWGGAAVSALALHMGSS